MNVIPINIPGAKVKGQLLSCYDDPRDLDQDILEIDLPNGLTIEAGWHPEYDPNGSFRITVFSGHWKNRVGESVFIREPRDVMSAVERLARSYSVWTPENSSHPRPASFALPESVSTTQTVTPRQKRICYA